jgi:hypothetical protein
VEKETLAATELGAVALLGPDWTYSGRENRLRQPRNKLVSLVKLNWRVSD